MHSLSETKLLNVAGAAIREQLCIQRVPKVLWAGLEESEEDLWARTQSFRQSWRGRVLIVLPYGYRLPPGAEAVPLARKLFELLHPNAPARYRIAAGGRGSGKSHAFATVLVLRALSGRLRILCAREFQRSLRESVHALLTEKIDSLRLQQFFDVTDRAIRCTPSGAEFLFEGLSSNISALKSMEGINLAYIEQGETTSKRSLEVLAPTIRAPNSEIWISVNPDDPEAPVQKLIEGTRADVRHVHVNYDANPWLPEALEAERAYMERTDQDLYHHVWLGSVRVFSDAQVFRGKYSVEPFTVPEGATGPYYGSDWGFSRDPTTLVKCWVHDKRLYVEHEAYQLGCDVDRTPALFDHVPGAKAHVIRADSARPETISYMQAHGYPRVQAVRKWPGSVEDGISFLRGYEKLIVHPRCAHTAEELRLYSFKVDKLTGDVLPKLADKFNHCIDAIRYAVEPAISQRRQGTIVPLRI